MPEKVIRRIGELEKFIIRTINPVSGGDINKAYCIETTDGKYFFKLNSASNYPEMMKREAEGLSTLNGKSPLIIPRVIFSGTIDGYQYLCLQWLDNVGRPQALQAILGEGIANLHLNSGEKFGWYTSNYIGCLVQNNDWYNSWSIFYAEQRIIPLVKVLFNSGKIESSIVASAEKLCTKFEGYFPEEKPSLLHGDLWSGNVMAIKSNDEIGASIFDPAVYYGNREMDIGMTLLFGGFDQNFYSTYNSIYPLKEGWKDRVELTQLYPLLVHAILFGGSYIQSCKAIISRWS